MTSKTNHPWDIWSEWLPKMTETMAPGQVAPRVNWSPKSPELDLRLVIHWYTWWRPHHGNLGNLTTTSTGLFIQNSSSEQQYLKKSHNINFNLHKFPTRCICVKRKVLPNVDFLCSAQARLENLIQIMWPYHTPPSGPWPVFSRIVLPSGIRGVQYGH